MVAIVRTWIDAASVAAADAVVSCSCDKVILILLIMRMLLVAVMVEAADDVAADGADVA